MNRLLVIGRYALPCLVVMFLTINAGAQDQTPSVSAAAPLQVIAGADQTPAHPLKPPSTMSPRDTLRGFLADMKLVVQDAQDSGYLTTISGQQVLVRAGQMLDYSLTPDGDSSLVRIRRRVLLKETLYRLKLPPCSEIPGVEEVATQSLTK